MKKPLIARMFQGLIFLLAYLISWFLIDFFWKLSQSNRDLNYIALGSAIIAILITPKIKTIKSQSGYRIQVTSFWFKGIRYIG